MTMLNAGLVGCGMIRTPYLEACSRSRWLNLVACADKVEERAMAACKEVSDNGWGQPSPCDYETMLSDDSVDLVINITNPAAHYRLNKMALEAGKHVHSEKPLCVTLEEAADLLRIAEKNGVKISCAPDTFLGCGHQTVRAAIDSGAIGEPTAASFFFAGAGPDGYHQDPDFFFQAGGGPMLDVGVYSLTQIISLAGAVKNVAGHTKITFPERTVLSSKRYGEKMKVEVPTHVSASIEFENGLVGTFITSFDIKGGHNLPHAEIYGTEGTISLPDPNGFTGRAKLFRPDNRKAGWQELEPTHGYTGRNRGIGAADLAASLEKGRAPRASGELAYHVLDAALTIYKAASERTCLEVPSTIGRPAPMPEGPCEDIED